MFLISIQDHGAILFHGGTNVIINIMWYFVDGLLYDTDASDRITFVTTKSIPSLPKRLCLVLPW